MIQERTWNCTKNKNAVNRRRTAITSSWHFALLSQQSKKKIRSKPNAPQTQISPPRSNPAKDPEISRCWRIKQRRDGKKNLEEPHSRHYRKLLLTQITTPTPLLEIFQAMRARSAMEGGDRGNQVCEPVEELSEHRRHGRCSQSRNPRKRSDEPKSDAPLSRIRPSKEKIGKFGGK